MVSRFSCTRCALGAILPLTLALMSACGTSGHPAGAGTTKALAAPSSSSGGRAAATPRPPVIRAGRTIRRFSGTGNAAIGTLSQKNAIVLQWSTSAPRFQLFTAQGFLILDSHARAGRLRLAAGDYSRLRVASPARWTLLLRASA